MTWLAVAVSLVIVGALAVMALAWRSQKRKGDCRTIEQQAEELFDMAYVRLHDRAAQIRQNRFGEFAEPVGKHVAAMVGKEERDLTADDVERAVRSVDPEIRMPSQLLVGALGGIERLRGLCFSQIHELQDSELFVEGFLRNSGARLTPDDLNNVAKEYLWLSRPQFFEALALRFELPDFNGSSMDEFAPLNAPDGSEKLARRKIREAIELGPGAAQNAERKENLAEALRLAPRYQRKIQGIAYAFGAGSIERAAVQ